MSITGYLGEFSLAELFQFLEQGLKTGLLTLKTDPDSPYYIWFYQGRVVAAAKTKTGDNLLSLIRERKMVRNLSPENIIDNTTPLGLSLKTQNLLDSEQLKMLFTIQVMRSVCTLFTWSNGSFEFDFDAEIPLSEMTGLSAPATEISLAGLRVLKDWSALEEKLPAGTSALIGIVEGQSKFRLNQIESQIWEFTDGVTSLDTIAKQLGLPLETIRKAAFRLIVIGLAGEIPMVESTDNNHDSVTDQTSSNLSQSFLENLVNFLNQV